MAPRLKTLAAVGLVVWIGMVAAASSQSRINVKPDELCGFYPISDFDSELFQFDSSADAKSIVKRITDAVGLPPRFEIYASNVSNAAAVIHENKRLILYSESWVQNVLKNDSWRGVTLLAHEIGHHLASHTLEEEGSRPETELEADRFAGFVVARMGGGLDDAQRLYRMLPKEGSATHPGRGARLEAVAVGWRDGRPRPAAGGGTASSSAEPEGERHRVIGVRNDDVLNGRDGPGAAYRILFGVPHDADAVYVQVCRGSGAGGKGWCRIAFKGQLGWVNSRYLAAYAGGASTTPAATPGARLARVVGVASNDVLNVRARPSAKGTLLGAMPHNATGVRVGACQKVGRSTWCEVEYGGVKGWASARYLAFN